MASSVIQDAQQRLRYGKRKGPECYLLWRTSLGSAVEDKDWIDGNAAELAGLVLEAVRAYTDHKSERAVLSLAQTAASRSDAFVKALAAGVVKQSAGLATGKLSRREAYGLLTLGRVAVQKLDPAAAKKAVSKLVEVQGSLADALAGGDIKWQVVSRQLRGEVQQQPAVAADMLEVAKAPAPTVPPGAPNVLARTMLDVANKKPEQHSATQQELLTLFCDKVVNGRDRVTPTVAACYARLFNTITADDFNTKVMPAVTRSLRRTPEVAMTALSALLAGSRLDISSHAPELATILVQQLRLKEAVRPLAVATLQQVAARTEDAAALSQMVGGVKGLLDGSAEGKIKAVAERVVLTQALTALAASPCSGDAYAALVDTAAAFTATAAKEEANDEARGVLLTTTAAWLARAPGSAGCMASVLGVLSSMLKEAKDVPRKQALRAAVQAVSVNSALRDGFLPLVEPAAKVVCDALAKPALRLEGVLALTAATAIAASNTEADAVLERAGVWAGACKPDSPLLGLAGAAKLAAADAPHLVTLAECLLLSHATRLAATPGAQDLVCRLLAAMCLHYSHDVRRAASTALGRVAAAPRMLRTLSSALSAVASSPAATLAPLAVAPDAVGEDAVLQQGTLALRLSLALRALLPKAREAPLDAAELCAVLLASHHPLLTRVLPRKAAASVWAALARHLPGLAKTLPGMAAPVTQTLFGSGGVTSTNPTEVAAAQSALGACMAVAPTAMMPHVLDALAELLDRQAHDVLSQEELDVWDTPRGMLASERVPEGVYVGQVVESKNVRKARGRFKTGDRAFGGDDDDDDEPVARRPAAPAARPAANGAARGVAAGGRGPGGAPGKKDAAARQAEWRQAKLEEEEQTRVRVEGVAARVALGCDTLVAVVAGNTRAASLRLEQLQQLVMPLLPSHIAGTAAFEAVKALASCLPAPINHQALSVAAALRLVALAQAGDKGVRYADICHAAQVADVVHAMKKATGERRPLPGPTYRFLFPILQALLSSSTHTPQHDEALSLLSLHCGVGMDVPRAASLALLQHLLGVIPAYRDRVAPLLKQLASGCSAEVDVVAAARGVLHAASAVRAASLASLQEVPGLTTPPGLPAVGPELVCLVLVACHDVDEDNAQLAKTIWEQAGFAIPADYVVQLVAHVTECQPEVQQAAAAALSSAAKAHKGTVGTALAAIIDAYQDGDVLARRGCATALKAVAGDLGDAEVTTALDFLIGCGLADSNDKVREEMVSAGTALVDTHGSSHAPRLLPLFEGYLDNSKRKGAASGGHEEAAYDLVREGVVVFMGTLARHLPPDDPKRGSIVDTLVQVLSTPSEAVQRAVSNCLSPLMVPLAANREAIDKLVAGLLASLTKGKTYGDRRGAAYGLAGVVKGLGIMSMKNAGIMDALKAAVEDKKDPAAREGALLAFECLSEKLGKLFEPYIIYILPLLLNCFGDAVPQVRAATEDAARMIMGQLTASGVKLVLPSLLKGLEDKAWRTKQGSVQLLGSMAYCAPKQLGSCLPTIVPRLSEVLSDPHPKVQAAANESLREIGSVIRNPEVSSLVPSLLTAIADPNNATRPALDVLLETVFVNTIDAASLALIVPVIHRGLRDRTGDTKKRAARIAGNMASLVNDPKDMVPYVPLLRPELQKALVDPLPEVRAFAARAMGSLLQGMGTEQFGDVVPWLTSTLRSDGSSVERSGAAQGLAEVLAVLGPNHLEALLPELLAGCGDRTSPSAREGHLVLLQYLPITLEATFAGYLGRVLPAVLDGLSDESEGVRDAALGAGRILVDHYANSALDMLLPAVEEGIFADNWRIRHSSVKLLGKLLFKVAGTSGNVVLDGGSDDEGAAEDSYNEAIIHALGMERRNDVLSRLYMCRSDPQYPVRTEALHVWKSVVPNTPKTLGQLLPALMNIVIESLAHESEDRQTMAGRCLGELVRKMGERVLSRIIPILVAGVRAESVATRQGVCLGMKEVLENIGRQQMAEHLADVLPAVQAALCDDDVGVREAAGAAFSILFKGGAGSAVDSVVPSMLEGLSIASKYGESVEGLRVILGVRPQMLNSVLPKLMKQPLQLYALNALRELAGVSSPVLQHHIKSVLPPLLLLANKSEGGPKEEAAAQALNALAAAVPDDAVHLLMAEMQKALDEPPRRRAAAQLIAAYAAARKHSPEPLLECMEQLLDALISLFADEDQSVVAACWKAVEALAGLIPKEEAATYVRCVKDAVATAKETERRKRTGRAVLVAGLCLPKALSPLLPIFLQGVLQGASTEVREAAAEGLGELVSATSEEALKPYVVQITGPLIRIVGDRFPSQIKAAILVTLGALIVKAGVGLKPFVPQLQTTFLKCLADPADTVRLQAASNLGELSRMSPRVEQLATELATLARTADAEVRGSYLTALRGLLANSGERLSPAVSATLGDGLRDMAKLTDNDDNLKYVLAGCMGAHAKHAPEEQVKATLSWGPLNPAPTTADRVLHAYVLATVVGSAGPRLQAAGLVQPIMDAATKFARDQQIATRIAAGRAAGRLAAAHPAVLASACSVLGGLMGPDQNSEVQRQALLATRRMAAALAASDAGADVLEPHLAALVPPMCAIASTTSGPIKVTSELSLVRVLQLEGGPSELVTRYLAAGPGSMVRTTLTDPFMRRVCKLSEEDELFAQEEY